MRLQPLSFGLFLFSFIMLGSAFALEIPLTVREPSGIARSNEPVISGVPLPSGTQTTNWSLWDKATEIPIQVTKLRGRDNWILLDFQLSIPSSAKRNLTLKDLVPSAIPANSLSAIETNSLITVNTGPLQVTISKTSFNLFEGVWLNGTKIITSSGNNIQIVDAITGNTFLGNTQAPDSIAWEYKNPLRAVLRVDGRYFYGSTEFIGYTTRLTFYAGRVDVKIEHILRNSHQSNERPVKITSAKLLIGTGAATLRASRTKSIHWANVGSKGLTFETLPTTMAISYVGDDVNVDANGGKVIPDLTHEGRTIVVDFSTGLSSGEQTRRATAVDAPLFAMAAPSWYATNGNLTVPQFGSLQDEKDSYKNWGWTWTSRQVPSDPASPDYYLHWPDVHGDTESDDLWQNLTMYLRTGSRGYFDRMLQWAKYFKERYPYRTDGFTYAWNSGWENPSARVTRPLISIPLTKNDNTYFTQDVNTGKADIRQWGADHMWGWGLLDYYYLTGDSIAIEAAVDLAEISDRIFGWRTPGIYRVADGGSLRQASRNFLLVTRTWEVTQDTKWQTLMNHIKDLFLQSPDWDSRGAHVFQRVDTCPTPNVKMPKSTSAIHLAFLSQAFDRYYQVTGNTQIRDRMIQMAQFASQFALHSTYQYTGYWLAIDYPKPGDVWHDTFDRIPSTNCPNPLRGFDPGYTIAWIDILMRGYRLTGDTTYLTRAKYHWDRGSKGVGGHPDQRAAGPNQVYHFMNDRFLSGSGIGGGGGTYYAWGNGDLSYASLLFYYSINPLSSPSVVNAWTKANPTPSSRWKPVPQNPDPNSQRLVTRSEPFGRSYTGIAYGKGNIYYFGGAHGSYPGNDVETYNIANNIWKQSYKPNVPPSGDPVYGSGGSPYSWVDPRTGEVRPYTIHGYGRTAYHPGLDSYVCSASFCKTVSGSPGNYSCTDPDHGNPNKVELVSFNPNSNKWTRIASMPGGAYDLTQWDSGLGGFLAVNGSNIQLFQNGSFSPYDTAKIGGNKVILSAGSGSGGSASVYIQELKSHLFAVMPAGNCCGDYRQGHLYLYNSIKKTLKEITSVPASLKNQFAPEGNFVMAYDNTNKKVVGLSAVDKSLGGDSQIQTWIYDPFVDTWEQLPISASSPLVPGFSANSRTPFQYDPINNVFILLVQRSVSGSDGVVQTWVYRYKQKDRK